jgi:Zn ribbon nucleic-acid-binding protein
MSDGEDLWREDGTPRREHPRCVFCGADEIESSFDDAQCRACGWKGSLVELIELEFKVRPGLWLLDFLERREISLCSFALRIGMGRSIGKAQSNIRKYTHPPSAGPAAIRDPSHKMVVRWAIALGVDPGSFYRSRTAKE